MQAGTKIGERVAALSRSSLWPVVIIATLGFAAAAFCFGVLNSEAEVGLGYSAGGAFAGALIAWSTLGALYFQVLRSSTSIREIVKQNEELQHKLLRGAPRPSGFEIEVDERMRLVLARPGDWQPGGGVIFDFQLPYNAERHTDMFPARFRVATDPVEADDLEEGGDVQAAFYKRVEEEIRGQPGTRAPSMEIVYVGGEPEGIRSLRMTARTYARARVVQDPNRRQPTFTFEYVNEDVFRAYVYESVSAALRTVRLRKRDVEDGEHERGLDAMATDAATAQTITQNVVTALEDGNFPHEERLEGTLEKILMEEFGVDAGDGAAPTREDPTSSPSAVQGADAVTSPTSTVEAREEIVPIVRTTVVSYHKDLRHVFLFDFADNPADYVWSSEVFTQIIRSVRFLI